MPDLILSLDAMGGDNGPDAVIPGVNCALKDGLKAKFLIFGIADRVEPLLAKYPNVKKNSEFIAVTEVVTSEDRASKAIRKKGTSMYMAIQAVKDGKAHGVISSGNTGALMATARLILRTLPGVDRPFIASMMPTMKGRSVVLDLGANLTTDTDGIIQMAVLGSIFGQINLHKDKPTVGLLNVGSEDQKGHEYIRQSASVLSDLDFPGQYYGFIEGDDIGKGTTDVVVTDGFTGNVALKTAEGIGRMSNFYMREAFTSSIWSKIGYLFASRAIKRVKSKLDSRLYNGGLFLGLQGVCIKSHGGTDAFGFSRALLVAAEMVRMDYTGRVADAMKNVPHFNGTKDTTEVA